MKILLLDNYDSFTFNLFQLLAGLNDREPLVIANDRITLEGVEELAPDCIVISPGPGRPERVEDFGVCGELFGNLELPILGVCLGHQGLVHAFGGDIVAAPEPMHGRLSRIFHDGHGVFAGVPQGFVATRYHSLIAADGLPRALEPTAWTEDGLIMGVRHRELPFAGVQFHPESISTSHRRRLLGNFLDRARREMPRRGSSSARATPAPSAPAVERRRDEAEPNPGYRVASRRLDLFPDPDRVFRRLFAPAARSFRLDCSPDHPELSRFTFMGAADGPHAEVVTYRLATGEVRVESGAGERRLEETIFSYLKRELRRRACDAPELPFDFVGGWVGYFGYELKELCGGSPGKPAEQPDAAFVFADRLLAFDHRERVLYLVQVGPTAAGPGEGWFDEIESRLGELAQPRADAEAASPRPSLAPRVPAFRLDRDRKTYLADIGRCLEALRAGESYEVCLTNQIRTAPVADPLGLYEALRRRNPAPYAAFLEMGDFRVVCASPERFLKIDRDRRVTAKPIKGTMARGADAASDERLRRRLAESEKDRAENLMIVDLLRNDLGSVCRVGSVTVPKLMEVESFATVHQLVSTVAGELRPELDAVDCVVAAFPGGSMTGAPKIRTMEIIDSLETRARGVYSGALGFLSLAGTCELNIVIRTAVDSGSELSIGVGGAIVALSDPQAEYDEILLKARALIEALVEVGSVEPDAWRGDAAASPVSAPSPAASVEP